jgi:hypothetical protein
MTQANLSLFRARFEEACALRKMTDRPSRRQDQTLAPAAYADRAASDPDRPLPARADGGSSGRFDRLAPRPQGHPGNLT